MITIVIMNEEADDTELGQSFYHVQSLLHIYTAVCRAVLKYLSVLFN